MCCKLVAYKRVSTSKQGESGLGLEGQETAIQDYAARSGCKVVATFTEIETGKRDGLENRPQLRAAIEHAKLCGATLVIAKLDRLSRSVYVTAELHRSGVEFVCCDNPTANRLTIQILAAVAEDEARRISERTKVALKARRSRGLPLGAEIESCRNLSAEDRARGCGAAAVAVREKSADFYAKMATRIKELADKGMIQIQIVEHLNASGLQTQRGKPWNQGQVSRILSKAR